MLKVFLITQLYDENPAWKIKLPDSDPDQLYEYHETNFMMSVLIRSYWKTNLGQKMRKLHFIQCRKKTDFISHASVLNIIFWDELLTWGIFLSRPSISNKKERNITFIPKSICYGNNIPTQRFEKKKCNEKKCFSLESLCQQYQTSASSA